MHRRMKLDNEFLMLQILDLIDVSKCLATRMDGTTVYDLIKELESKLENK